MKMPCDGTRPRGSGGGSVGGGGCEGRSGVSDGRDPYSTGEDAGSIATLNNQVEEPVELCRSHESLLTFSTLARDRNTALEL